MKKHNNASKVGDKLHTLHDCPTLLPDQNQTAYKAFELKTTIYFKSIDLATKHGLIYHAMYLDIYSKHLQLKLKTQQVTSLDIFQIRLAKIC